MKSILSIIPICALGLGTQSTSAATFSLSTASAWSFYDDAAQTSPLAAGSVVQVGFFLGIDATTNPSTFTEEQWNTFTPIVGIGSLNPMQTLAIRFANVDNPSVFGGAFAFTDADDTPFGTTDPIRLGFRIFDSEDPTQGEFNTVSNFEDAWVLTNQNQQDTDQGPILRIGRSAGDTTPGDSNPRLAWQDDSSPFATTIQVVPEPSTSLTALLGLGLLIGARRRK